MSDHRSLELAGTAPPAGQQLSNQAIIADIGGSTYGIPVQDLVEVEHVPNIAPVPNTRDWLRGVVNLRGAILTLIDPARLLDVGEWNPSPLSRMLVVDREDPVALAVDRLRGMRQLNDPVSLDLLDDMPGKVADYVEAIYRDGDAFIRVVDIRRLLNDADTAASRSSESMPHAGGGPLEDDISVMERGAS
ncbi:MAG: chemotaxis protein CheW [Thermomicrobiales bacterium]